MVETTSNALRRIVKAASARLKSLESMIDLRRSGAVDGG